MAWKPMSNRFVARSAVLGTVLVVLVVATSLVYWQPAMSERRNLPFTGWIDDGVGEPSYVIEGADPDHGKSLLRAYGCIACHTVPGVAGADGMVGPPLTDWSERVYIAGMLPNTPENLVTWIMDPQAIVPGNAMPQLGVSEEDAKDIASFLYTLGHQEK